ncbi:L-lactate dehydrogenase [Clostridium acetireducens DSM 10703]|jgi:L-lactate dehydrogenase|uniref:L-lactate dehydrogenase n=1 Tax=Clostridium acetireducens DSM 10703 TaxID=1121290 RepID=A0A1E8EZ14_9CLOT|nr:L-lactate dehydrogenase [Clostridium acetireducens]OFI05926.1 L-lactate dehydrogenase [Clostridium acetireducens DSM 10703]
MKDKNIKISIIGAGHVGSTTAYSIVVQKLASKVVLLDIDKDKAKSEAMEIGQSTVFRSSIDVEAGDYSCTKDSDIVIIAAGVKPEKGQSRLDIIEEGLEINKDVIPQVIKYNPNAIIIQVANPLDVLTYQTHKISGFPKNRIIGSGTVIDSARLRHFISKKYGVGPQEVNAWILGEHGDSQVVMWSIATIGGIPIDKTGLEINDDIKAELANKAKTVGYDVVNKKGYTSYAIASSVTRIVRAIVKDEKAFLTVSALYSGEYGIDDVCIAAPCIIGANGIEKIVNAEISEDERKGLHNSAKILKELNKKYI